MAYSAILKPGDYFNTILHTGTGSAASLTGVGFEPSMVWAKQRNGTDNNNTVDAVRGVQKIIQSDTDTQEQTSSGSITSFDSDGFSVGTDNAWNGTSNTYVMWNWKASGAGSSNEDGSINTTATSVNTTAGFSISTYTGTGSNATVGHGLGVVPKMIMVKRLDSSSDWRVYHSAAGAGSPATKQLFLNRNVAEDDDNTIWNDTAPTSSVFTVGTNTGGNASGGTYVAYCFIEKKGFSEISKWKGNGNADGPFIHTGFKPAFIISKNADRNENWLIHDNKRGPINVNQNRINPNDSGAESSAAYFNLDFLSNGFKIRSTDTALNQSGEVYVFMAFAEEPLVASNGTPATAR